jgi:hypothetical protein
MPIAKTEIEVQISCNSCELLVLNCRKMEDWERIEGMELIYVLALFTST